MAEKLTEFPPGTLNDASISSLANSRQLIVENFEPKSIRQACYELRASDIFYEVAKETADSRVCVSKDTGYILAPKCYVTAVVLESIALPTNVLGRILTKGHLFALGIVPVNTYADPGFSGRLGITLCNLSNRYVRIPYGEPIAKIEFSILPQAVKNPYSGQHGYESQIWPKRVDLLCHEKELRQAGMIGSAIDELRRSHGPEVAWMAGKLDFYSRWIWIQVAITLVVLFLVLALMDRLPLVVSVGAGVASNLFCSLVLNQFGPRRNVA